MSAIIGDAKIKVTLDVDAAKRKVDELERQTGGGGSSSGGGSRRGPKQDPLNWRSVIQQGDDKPGQREFRPPPVKFEAMQETNLIAALRAAWAAYMVKQVIDAVEASPKFISLVKGITGIKDGGMTLDHVSNEITKIKSWIDAFSDTAGDMKNFGRAALQLGQHPTLGGSLDFWSFLLNMNQRMNLMNNRVEKEIDKDIFEKLGESARLTFCR